MPVITLARFWREGLPTWRESLQFVAWAMTGRFRAVFALILTSSVARNFAFTINPSASRLSTAARRTPPPFFATITSEAEPLLRRQFVQTSISIAGAQSAKSLEGRQGTRPLSSMHAAQPLPPLRVCVVGAGSISREFALYHFNAATQTVVTSVVDLDEDRARRLATDVGSVQAGASIKSQGAGGAYSAAASDTRGTPVPFATRLAPCLGDCDVVYIGTTPNSHAELVLEALAAGKSVLMEKPLASTAQDADAIVAAAEQAEERGQILGMDIGMRWNPALHEMRRIAVTERQLGQLKGARLTLAFTQWPRDWQVQPWAASRGEGGALREVGTHFFFGMMELFGERCVERVMANVEYKDGLEGSSAEVAASGTMRLGARARGWSCRTEVSKSKGEAGHLAGLDIALDVRTNSTVGDVYELELVGDRGSLLLQDFCRLKRTAPTEKYIVPRGSYGRVESVVTLVDAIRGAGDAVGSGKGGRITARQGRNAQRLLDAVVASKGLWVDVRYD